MHDRSLLGPADISDERLTEIVADSLGVDHAELVSSSAEVADYDLESLTTAGRYWVRGIARVAGAELPFAFFVKVVQSWGRSPMFRTVPEQVRDEALKTLPWQSEPLVYRTNLAELLPAGLSMPRLHALVDIDDESAGLWLEAVDTVAADWDTERLANAAYLLGRLAASAVIQPLALAGDPDHDRTIRAYFSGRLTHQVLPMLRSSELWQHPLMANTFDADLRDRLLRAIDDIPALLDELDAMTQTTGHGDACTRNLLVTDGPDIVLIDYGFWGRTPVGHDLSQLILGEVQMGERAADCLPELEAACLPAYVRGLADEGLNLPVAVVRRSHALLMLLFAGFSAPPFEHLGVPPTPELEQLARHRAASARFILDLVAETADPQL
jgi:hypothetical protein